MQSVFDWIRMLGPAGFVLQAILFSAIGIGLLLGFILVRRAYRRRYFRQLNARTFFYRKHWKDVLSGRIPAKWWRLKPLDCEIVESILLGELERAEPQEASRLIEFLRSSGLLDLRLFEARKCLGWRRRNALLSLGRMRTPEAIPVLAEALDDPAAETRLAAVRGLGRTALPEGAEPILQRVAGGLPEVAAPAIQDALLRCCASTPAMLLRYLPLATDGIRPLLARVLGELGCPGMDEDLALLTTDELAEVRASAARALGLSGSLTALNALARLVEDPEWFVRLRAVAAVGGICDPRAIPFLIVSLCDENRLVRLRAAKALSRFEDRHAEILRAVMATGDEYALQAFVSQIERMGAISKLIEALVDPDRKEAAEAVLLDLLRAGAHRMLLDALSHHAQARVRTAVARTVARSGDQGLLPQLEQLLEQAESPWQRRVVGWTMRQLRGPSGTVERHPMAPV